MQIFTSIDDLVDAAGVHLGYSEWHDMTQEMIDRFALATGDHQWIHVDRERSAEGPFGTTIAHGYLTLSMVSMLAWEVYRVEGVRMVINYGANRLRFPAPVPAGSRVRAGVQLQSVTERDPGLDVRTLVIVELAASAKPACVAECLTLVVP
ncbi:MAG: MaoC family dehydratase [Nocardioides sp.]|uniref:MaoC family dehydratase n=1 Tax=Nocardioides sp. TaxID=35761 RepID=UPI0039E508EE